MQAKNLKAQFDSVSDYFSPKVVGSVNDVFIKIAKIKGDKIPWHNHENEDELFYILEGSLLFEVENQAPFTMNTGDYFIVPQGVNHKVSAVEECKLMLIENKTTAHTGKVDSEITRSIEEQL